MTANSLNFFSCLFCKAEVIDDDLTCEKCSHTYQAYYNIPLLIKDPTSHLEMVNKMIAEKPTWYSEPQLAEKDSPYKHHLRKRRRYITAVINKLTENGQKKLNNVLDLGCGEGNHLKLLSEFSHHTFASDYSILRLQRSVQFNLTSTHFLADILDYPSKDNFFDMVFCNHVIEHIADDISALQTMFRILKPGGTLILGTPNEGSWWWQLAYRNDPESRRVTDHVQFYTSDSLKQRLESVGFKIDQIHFTGWGPPSWKWSTILRRWKIVDDIFEIVGRLLMKKQASSLYFIASKKEV